MTPIIDHRAIAEAQAAAPRTEHSNEPPPPPPAPRGSKRFRTIVVPAGEYGTAYAGEPIDDAEEG